jgi:multidrug efflux pump
VNLTKLAIENNRLTLVSLLVILLAGWQTFLNMPRAYDPGFVVRTAQVITYLPGASPERIELLLSSKIEDAVKDIPELDFVQSENRTGISIVLVNIKESYKDMRPIWDNLRRKIQDITPDLPTGVVGPFVNDEFGDVYGIVIAMTGEGFNYGEMSDIAEDVQSALLRLGDVAKVDILGEQDERVFVEYDNARLAELGISPSQLSAILKARNIVISGGAFDLDKERIALEPSGNFESISDIEKTIIQIKGHSLYLRDIAKIVRGYVDPPESIVHSSGERALAIAVAMRDGGNNIDLGDKVKVLLDEQRQLFPYGIEFDLVSFSPTEVDRKVKDFVNSLLQSIAIVTVVMLFSLGMRTGLVVACLIPTTMLLSLMVMSVFDIGLDQISLAALIIALGMLVDNGIVMSESILVQMERGKAAMSAAIDTANEMRMPLLVASLTTAAAFLPIFLAESKVGEFTASLFKVVTITLLCSWVISMTVIPLLCVYLLKVSPKKTNYEKGFYRRYADFLHTLLQHKWLTVGATVMLFIGVMSLFSVLPAVFFPPSDRLYFKAEFELPTGSNIHTTQQVVSEFEDYIQQNLQVNPQRTEGVTHWVSYIGNAGPRFLISHNPKPNNNNYALMIISVTDFSQVNGLMNQLQQYADQHYPDLDLTLRLIENGPAVENPVEVRLSGDNKNSLFTAVGELKQQMLAIGGLTNISDNWGQRIKKLDIQIDQARALRAGVTSQDIATSLQAGLSGVELSEYREEEDIIPIILRSNVANNQNISKLESLVVYAQGTGQAVPLRQVADIHVVWDEAKILRRNGFKNVSVGAQLQDGITAAEKFAELVPWLEQQKPRWHGKVRYELGGESESSGEANQSIKEKLGIAGFIILALLIMQFNSLRKSFIVLTTIPLGMIGVILGLLAGQSYFGFMTFLGIISLAGIVINNAIVLLERIQIELDEGLEQSQAIISASLQRARPIILTTATTVLGMLPLYLGGGAMWEPMAISIMAGLLFSTLLTLCLVPVLYALMFKKA